MIIASFITLIKAFLYMAAVGLITMAVFLVILELMKLVADNRWIQVIVSISGLIWVFSRVLPNFPTLS